MAQRWPRPSRSSCATPAVRRRRATRGRCRSSVSPRTVDEESKGEIKIQPFLGLATGQRAGHGAAGGARANRYGRLLRPARPHWSLPEIGSAGDALLFPQHRRVRLRARQPHDQAGDRGLRQEGRAVPRLEPKSAAIDLFGKKPFMAPPDLKGAKAAIYANKTQALFFTLDGRQRQPARPAGMDPGLPDRHGRRGADRPSPTRLPSGTDQGGTGGLARHGLRLAGADADEQGRLRQAEQASPGGAAARRRSAIPSAKLRGEVRGFEGHAVRHA